MNNEKGRILFIEDDKIDQKAFERFVKNEKLHYDYVIVGSVNEAKHVLEKEKFDAVLMDYMLGDGTAFDLIEKIRNIPFIIVTGDDNEEIAVQAMKAGAYDYLTKDIEGNYLKALPITIRNAIRLRQAEEEMVKYREQFEETVNEHTVELQAEITECKQVEKILGENEEKWRLLYNNLPGGYFTVNNKYIIEDVNDVFCSLTGFTKEELIGKPCNFICPKNKHKCTIFESRKERITNEETSIKTKDGRLVPIIKSAIKIPQDNRQLIIANFQDITERKQIEQDLGRFKTISDNANYGVAITDLTGNIMYINEYLADVHGYRPDKLISKNMAIFHTSKQLLEMKKINMRLQKWGSFNAVEVWHVHRNGSVFPMLMNGMVIKEKNSVPLYIAVTAIDITDNKKAVEELHIAKEAAEAANKAKSTFLDNIIQKLHPIMNTIIEISKMHGKQNTENLSIKQTDGLKRIYECGYKLLTTINNILDLLKIEAGKMEVQLIPLSLTELMLDLEEIVKKLIGDKKINFLIKNIFLVPDKICSDGKKLHQILINILRNAVKFTEKGEIICTINVNQDRLYFEVKDTGIGISKNDMKYIFNEFRRVDSSQSKKYKGIGLSLALCKKMVKLLGGEIEAESVINHGTTVRFYIPLIIYNGKDIGESELKNLEKEISKIPGKSTYAKKKFTLAEEELLEDLGLTSNIMKYLPKILIAEGEKINWGSIKMILEHKYQLIFAENGKEAVEKYFSEKPDIVLMDIMMLEMNGYEAFNNIIKKKDLSSVKIIAVTTKAMKNERKKILEYGFDDYISKPIDNEILLEKLEKYLSKNVSEWG